MKKIITGLMFVLLIVLVLSVNVYAANGSINLQSNKSEASKNDEIVVNVEISGVKTTQGVAAMMATLESDKTSLNLEKIEGQNGWARPGYNENNGQLITDKNNDLSGNEVAIKFTFKVKDGAKENLAVSLKNVVISGGNGDIELANATKNITIKNGSSNSGENNSNGGSTGNQNSGSSNGSSSSSSNQNSGSNKPNHANNTSTETNATNNELIENNSVENNINEIDNTNENTTSNVLENTTTNNIKENNKTEKKGNTGLIIAGIILVGLLVAILIRIQVVKKRRNRRRKKN